eukprot:TRINITY_DN22309_c0_g1_i7.p1 TRINITY_DN22309_c0_g1~~TRINITY_DN22309_c0_g1_i7.p1  ORF type:complete len:231 (-),score=32.32 TRINITY_DN22309_c0_g1_i7:103-699(-)
MTDTKVVEPTMEALKDSGTHGKPSGECKLCYSDLEDENYVEYKIHSESEWLPSGYCSGCVDTLIDTQWHNFTELVGKETCRAALLRLVDACPLTLSDREALPCPIHAKPVDHKVKKKEVEKEKSEKPPCPNHFQISQIWYASSQKVSVPILKGAKTGKERETYLNDLREFAKILKDSEAEDDPLSTSTAASTTTTTTK